MFCLNFIYLLLYSNTAFLGKFATSNNYPVLDGNDDTQYTDVPDVDAERDKYTILKWTVQVLPDFLKVDGGEVS